MSLQFTIRVAEQTADVEASVPDGLSLGDLIGAAITTVPEVAAIVADIDDGSPLELDGRPVAWSLPVGEARLERGSELSLGQPTVVGHASVRPCVPRPSELPPVIALRSVGGLGAGRRWELTAGEHLVGRGAESSVFLDGPTVSRRHAVIAVKSSGEATIRDADSTNGTFADGAAATAPRSLALTGLVQVGANLLAAERPDPAIEPRRRVVHRGPRHDDPSRPEPVPAPADVHAYESAPRVAWAAVALPAMCGLIMAMVFSPMMAAFALLSPVMLFGNWWDERRRFRRERARHAGDRAAALQQFASDLEQTAAREVAWRLTRYPDPAAALGQVTARGGRLWERRRNDSVDGDALRLHLGMGRPTWVPPIAGSVPEPDGQRIVDGATRLPTCAVGCDLESGDVFGVAGPRDGVLAVARSLVLQAACWYGPADLAIDVVAAAPAAWDWVKWLPHPSGSASMHASDATSARASQAVVADAPGALSLLVVVDGQSPEDTAALVRLILRRCPAARILALAGQLGELPAAADQLLDLRDDGSGTFRAPSGATTELLVAGVDADVAAATARSLAPLVDPEASNSRAVLPTRVALVDLPEIGDLTADEIGCRWELASGDDGLRAVVGSDGRRSTTLDLAADGPHALVAGTTGSGKSELLRTWVVSLACTYGPEQLTFVLIDYKGGSAFAECAELPHTVGLVTDLDGALAERALRCLNAELRYRERLLRRAHASSLEAYRSPCSADSAVADQDNDRNDDPNGDRDGPGLSAREALPRLVIVIDEFATLASDVPDFLDALIGVAQRGRSLGMHLVLATQRPSGAVSDNIRANTNIRIGLRMQDASDSLDVIGAPEAACLDRRHPGRAFVRLGPSELMPFQAALVSRVTGAGQNETAVHVEAYRRSTAFAEAVLAEPSTAAPPKTGATTHEAAGDGKKRPTDLERLVLAVRGAFSATGQAQPRRPWPEPLPTVIERGALAGWPAADTGSRRRPSPVDSERVGALAGGSQPSRHPGVAIGLVDDLDRQRQGLLWWGPADGNMAVIGGPATGKTTALATVALALAEGYGPERLHLYVVESGARLLGRLADLPHCGGVIGAGDREGVERFVRLLGDEVGRRRRLDPLVAMAEPLVVGLIDDYGALHHGLDDATGLPVRDELVRVIADGAGLGVVVVVAADRPSALPVSVSAAIAETLLLHLVDPYDVAAFGLRPGHVGAGTPGRAVHLPSRHGVHLALPGPGGLAGLAAVVANAFPGCAEDSLGVPSASTAPRLGRLPDRVTAAEIGPVREVAGELVIPVGVGDRRLEPIAIRLGPDDHVLVAGAARSGKSTLMAHLASAVWPWADTTGVALRPSPLRDADLGRLVTTADEIAEVARALMAAPPGRHVILVDDAEFVDDLSGDLQALITRRIPGIHVVAAGRSDVLRSLFTHWTQEIRRARRGLVLKPESDLDGELWQLSLPRRSSVAWTAGRGFLVQNGAIDVVQVVAGDEPTRAAAERSDRSVHRPSSDSRAA